MNHKGRPLKILFIHQRLWPYVERDLRILQTEHEVRECYFPGPDLTTMIQMLRNILTFFLGVLWCDVTYSWFGKLHAFLAVLFSKGLGKKSIVVAGGDDVANFLVKGNVHGLCGHPWKKWFSYFIFRFSDQIIAISRSNYDETIRNARANPKKVKLIYHGFDSFFFQRKENVEKSRSALTVAQITSENYERKGLKLFVQSAWLLPDVPFYIVGPTDNDSTALLLKKTAPQNVIMVGPLYGPDLVEVMSKAAAYIQASEWESFGCSVAEAMLCECVPVVSRRTSLPEVVGDCGFYLDELEPEELAAKIRTALEHPEMGKQARQRIIEHFPLEKRKQAILEVVETLT